MLRGHRVEDKINWQMNIRGAGIKGNKQTKCFFAFGRCVQLGRCVQTRQKKDQCGRYPSRHTRGVGGTTHVEIPRIYAAGETRRLRAPRTRIKQPGQRLITAAPQGPRKGGEEQRYRQTMETH